MEKKRTYNPGFIIVAALCLGCAIFPGTAAAVEATVATTVFYKPAAKESYHYAEISWDMLPASLHYHRDSNGAVSARVHAEISMRNEEGVYYTREYLLQTPAVRPSDLDAQRVLDKRTIPLMTGLTTLSLRLWESEDSAHAFLHSDTLRPLFNAKVPDASAGYISGIQFADTIYSSTTRSPFSKGDKHVIPRTLSFYAEGQRRLRYYAEAYSAGPEPLIFTAGIRKRGADNAYFYLQQRDTLPGPRPLHVLQGAFSLASLPSGNYYLDVALRTAAGIRLDAKSVFFQLINKTPEARPAVAAPVRDTTKGKQVEEAVFLDLTKTFAGKYDDGQLRAILLMLDPIADPAEATSITGFLKKPDPFYSRYFIYNFFSSRNAAAPEKAWKEYSDKVRQVNRLFGRGGEGYTTDRGRMHLRYGPPDERVVVSNEGGAQPYEIWVYNALGKVNTRSIFLFYQPGSLAGEYRLLHSTAPEEVQNSQWRSILYMNGTPAVNNSKAEQYFTGR